jgi:general secretion pathway protein E
MPFQREEEHRVWSALCSPFKAAPPEQVYRPVGCIECRNTGYLGRIGIYEILQMTPEVRQFVQEQYEMGPLTQAGYKAGMRPLRVSGAAKVAQGLTTFDEVLKAAPLH